MSVILVVSADPAVRDLLTLLLSELDRPVVSCPTLTEAARMYGEYRISLIVQVAGPDLDRDLNLVRALRRLGRRTPLVVLAALPDAVAAPRSRDAGASAYVSMPFDIDAIQALCRSLQDRPGPAPDLVAAAPIPVP